MTSDEAHEPVGDVSDALLSRLRVIEVQPLEARAIAYVQVHDELRTRLEGSDQATTRG
ncbi:hypothetical protein [Subtercola sp. YIM 133946]|uniref:hypothetical protein n=1 Tax=Subtercola sp. YIM 133946 TaxID=3118909 RepID=UPI002F928E02